MIKVELPIFGKIQLKERETDWEYKFDKYFWAYDFEKTQIDLAIHFKEVSEQQVLKVASTLNKLSQIHLIGKKAIRKDFEEGEVVNEYIEEWNDDIFLQIFDEEGFRKFIENTNSAESIEERLFSLLRIVRVGIYAESEKSFVIMDFAFGYEDRKGFRDDMVVVTLNPKLEVTDICTEG